jgi:hypothetical protein
MEHSLIGSWAINLDHVTYSFELTYSFEFGWKRFLESNRSQRFRTPIVHCRINTNRSRCDLEIEPTSSVLLGGCMNHGSSENNPQ